jgi:FKBP-type peptidyl-prolyl cis-trans isomerase FklB
VQKWKNENWLDTKSNEHDVVTLPSGLMYKVLTSMYFGKTPTAKSSCVCHYAGSFIDETIFDSSYKRNTPVTFVTNQVIAGWSEALMLMKEGEKWELYIPSNLAYGENGQGDVIPGNTPLQFIIELLEVIGEYKDESTEETGETE